jgi:1,4-dihydroxy-2-naphthoate octaprenyltransferase
MASVATRITQFKYLVLLGRPVFLAGGFVFHGLGVVMALYAGARLDVEIFIWGQVAITAVQWMTHYSNEYFDLPADLANKTPTQWSGGSRILPDGRLPASSALVMALLLGSIAIAATLVLGTMLRTEPLTIPLLLLAIGIAWSYSAPPLRLQSQGVGEIVTALFVPGLTPVIGFYLQMGRLTWLPLLAVPPLCCLQFAMLMSINLPDAAGDAAAGKRTLVVRLGKASAARLHILSLMLAYVPLLPLVWAGLPAVVGAAVALSLPVALWQKQWPFSGSSG